jgi:hypothetical protein
VIQNPLPTSKVSPMKRDALISSSLDGESFPWQRSRKNLKDSTVKSVEHTLPLNTCIFHIGMPKTGTSSIQESLFFGLTDRSFRYFSFGEVNGSRGVTTLFGNPDSYFYHRQKGLTERDIKDYRRKWFGRLERALNKAAASGRKVIISAESGWLLNEVQMSAFRRFMEERDYTVNAVAYIRSWKTRIESGIAQKPRTGGRISNPKMINPRLLDYRAIIEAMDRAYGRENVQIFNYNPGDFPDGCVVKDFCERLGIRLNPENIRRSNDSLSLSAFRLLYTYRNLGPGFGVGLKWLILDWVMLRRLSELRGPALRYHVFPCGAHYKQIQRAKALAKGTSRIRPGRGHSSIRFEGLHQRGVRLFPL